MRQKGLNDEDCSLVMKARAMPNALDEAELAKLEELIQRHPMLIALRRRSVSAEVKESCDDREDLVESQP